MFELKQPRQAAAGSKASHPFTRRRLMTAALASMALLLPQASPVGANPGHDPRAPGLEHCPELKVPEGNKVLFHAYAEGVQIYRWNGAAWVFQRPEALLYADEGGAGVVGVHYEGPTWKGRDGSLVVAGVDQRCDVEGTIQWLRLRATDHEGSGIFGRVTYIQRVNTSGGTAPATGGTVVGEEAGVPYTGEYFFYRRA